MKNEEMYGYIKEMENLPVKEVKIYAAVGELIKEGKDVSNLTISEISNRAGIGKGTTYEYFDSKEELIYKALHYFVIDSLKAVLLKMLNEGSFKDKFYSIMDYMWESRLGEDTIQSIMSFVRNLSPALKEVSVTENPEKYDPCTATAFIEMLLKQYLNSGFEEGIFTEKDEVYRKNVLSSQVLLFLFLMKDIREEERKKEIEDYVYDGMIMLLNSRKND
ncbi:MAG: TetR/AcrR family transcriptional regulator [Lachnospiraceae bacterium]|nr:TetR/AcrR family transcriptional regulator [Lachnospiraceae bacterium]